VSLVEPSFTPSDWILLALVVSPIIGLVIWGVVRLRRARRVIRDAVGIEGLRLVAMHRRWFRQGPFSRTATRSQVVYRLIAQDASGRGRNGWARWGRTWVARPDRLELEWDD
jgi:hypothetical protein